MVDMILNIYTNYSVFNSLELVKGTHSKSNPWDIHLQGLSTKTNISFKKIFPFGYPERFIISGFLIRKVIKEIKRWKAMADGYHTVLIPRGKGIRIETFNFNGKKLYSKYLPLYSFKLHLAKGARK